MSFALEVHGLFGFGLVVGGRVVGGRVVGGRAVGGRVDGLFGSSDWDGNGREFLDVVSYDCGEYAKFELVETEKVTCLWNGTWDKSVLAECIGMYDNKYILF
jgi:hypothetical protein